MPFPFARTIRLILFAVGLAMLLIAVGIAVLQRVEVDTAIGNVVIRSQRGTTYPLVSTEFPTEPSNSCAQTAAVPVVANVILLIGDGMGLGETSTTSTLLFGPRGGLVVEQAPVVGLARGWATNNLTPDSAAAGTALATGFHTYKRAVSTLPDGRTPATLFEVARAHGLSTAIVTTAGLMDATPACFTSHAASRKLYTEIFDQMLESDTDIMVGGDWGLFAEAASNNKLGATVRHVQDKAAGEGYTLVRTEQEMLAADGRILGLFPSRNGSSSAHGPPLTVSARHAFDLLTSRETGWIAVIESEVIDETAHDNDISGLIEGVREFDEVARLAVDLANQRGDTLVVITADHDTGGVGIVDGNVEGGVATVRWLTDYHTATWLPVYAFGPGAEEFSGVYDLSEVGCTIARLLGLEGFPDAG